MQSLYYNHNLNQLSVYIGKLVKDKNGNIIGDEEGRMKRWMEYFSELLNADPPTAPITSIEPEWDKLDIDISEPNEEEIKKAAGYDDITGEIPKSSGKS